MCCVRERHHSPVDGGIQRPCLGQMHDVGLRVMAGMMTTPTRAQLEQYRRAVEREAVARVELEQAEREVARLELEIYPGRAHMPRNPPIPDTAGLP